ncbi:MAG: ParB/RepB/Spo0J family partition protein [Anaerolineae bacterium]|nr:ParB/RepB/Spo0J family partition protein [Anaerolineae bacterium]MDW8103043.1 ParB/RepB/Spo0J family partition protein [Anaerolineae bacterium]
MAGTKRGLGKGLEALIPSLGLEESGAIKEISVDEIIPNPYQPRRHLDQEALEELAQSIREHGLIQPLIVTRDEESGKYQLIAGERRWRAARMAGFSTVPVIVKEVSPREMLELALVENIQRADLNPLEEAEAYRFLIEEFGLTQEEVAKRVGKSRVAVANTVRLLRLPSEVKKALAEGLISEGHARALLALSSSELQIRALEKILKRGLNVRQTEELVRKLQEPGRSLRRETLPEIKELEEKLRESLGTKVQLIKGRKGGRLVIFFYSDEDLRFICERLMGNDLGRNDSPYAGIGKF